MQMKKTFNNEVWQDVQGFESIYQVSTMGRVRSLKKGIIKILTPCINNMGYLILTLLRKWQTKNISCA